MILICIDMSDIGANVYCVSYTCCISQFTVFPDSLMSKIEECYERLSFWLHVVTVKMSIHDELLCIQYTPTTALGDTISTR